LKFEKSFKSGVLFDSTFDEKLKKIYFLGNFSSQITRICRTYAIVENRTENRTFEAIRNKDRTYYPAKL